MPALNSSNLAACEYEDETRTLTVEFVSGSTYALEGVPREYYEGLVASLSPGRYYHANLRDQFPTRRVS